jgi:hypothetical protein
LGAAAFIAAALLFTGPAGTVGAQENNRQRVQPVDSEVYAALRTLYIARGRALPSTTGPWSEAELLLMLDRLDTQALSPGEAELYDRIAESLRPRGEFLAFRVNPNIEARAHTNPDDFPLPYQFYRSITTMRPFLDLDAELFLTDNAYLYFEWPVSVRPYYAESGSIPDGHPRSSVAGEKVFGLNIPFASGAKDLDANIPYRAFLSLGGRGWSAVAGRDRLSWGPGESGNFVVGDHVHYHNNLRTSFFNSRFKYTYSISSFAYPGEYYSGWDDENSDYYAPDDPYAGWNAAGGGGAEIKGVSLFIAHRGEMRFFDHRLNVVVTESIMYQSPDGNIGFEQLLPVLLLHNLYRNTNQNSLLAIEADYALLPGFNLYGQIAIDEFALPFAEGSASADSAANPNSLGFMLGLKIAFPYRSGVLQGSFESAYTTPYLYLQKEAGGFNSNSFVKANRYYNGSDYAFFAEEFLGYRWGGDALVFNLNASYARPAKWNAQCNLLLMLHGTHDRWTKWNLVYAAGSGQAITDSFLTGSHQGDNYADDAGAKLRNSISFTLLPSLSGSFFVWKNLEIYGQADCIASFNHNNIKGDFAADFQLTLGLSYYFRASIPAETHSLDR